MGIEIEKSALNLACRLNHAIFMIIMCKVMLIVMVLMCFLVYKPRSFVFFGFLCGQIGFQIVI